MSKHRHTARVTSTVPFRGPVFGALSNPAAHGNVQVINVCKCGAVRCENVNGRHIERGPWVTSHRTVLDGGEWSDVP